MNRRTFLIAIIALIPAITFAQLPPPAAPVAQLTATLASLQQAGRKTPFATRMQTLLPVVQQVFDLPVVLQNSVGPRWSSLPDEQKTQALDVFTQYTAAAYVTNFDTDNGDRFEILPELRAAGADQIVQTRIVPKSGDLTRIDYVMRQTANGWHAIDVLSQGISQVAVQRSDFRSLIRDGDATRLISGLRDKVAQYAAAQSAQK